MATALKFFYLLVQVLVCVGLIGLTLLKQSKDDGGGILGGPMQSNVRIQGADDTMDIWTKRLATAFLIFSFLGGVLFNVLG